MTVQVDWDKLMQAAQKPALFTPGEEHFWDDPYIATQMLEAHLSPDTDAASRKPQTIDRHVDWIVQRTGLSAGSRLFDLGCGPGLYAQRMAQRGIQVTGVDLSENSLAYARQQAQQAGLSIEYRHQDYRRLTDEARYDVAVLIYYDLGVLLPADKLQVLRNAYRALKPGGIFICDLLTRENRHGVVEQRDWELEERGFWRPIPYLGLHSTIHYPEAEVYLDQDVIVDASGKTSIYRRWEQNFTPQTASELMMQAGFAAPEIWADLCGTPYQHGVEALGIVAQKCA
ncbi:MAG: class I SAM-dependent methyltransferase [Clostridiaceae bacterium]